jgi:hypothetical protein
LRSTQSEPAKVAILVAGAASGPRQEGGRSGQSNVARKIARVSVSLAGLALDRWTVIVADAAVERETVGTLTIQVSMPLGGRSTMSACGPCVRVVVQLPTVQNHILPAASSAGVPTPFTCTPWIASLALGFCVVTMYCSAFV